MTRFCVPKRLDLTRLFTDRGCTRFDISSADSVAEQFDDEFYIGGHPGLGELVSSAHFHDPEDHWLTLGLAERRHARFKLQENGRFAQYNARLDEWGRHRPVHVRFIVSFAADEGRNRDCLASLARQSLGLFDVVVIADAATQDSVRAMAEALGIGHKIAAAGAFATLGDIPERHATQGERCYWTFLDCRTVISPDCVFRLACHVDDGGGTVAIYADEALVRADTVFPVALRKPEWSPEYCLASAYACGLSFFDAAFVARCLPRIAHRQPDFIEFWLYVECMAGHEAVGHLPHLLIRSDAAMDQPDPAAIVAAVEQRCIARSPRATFAPARTLYLPQVVSSEASAVSLVIVSRDGTATVDGRPACRLDNCLRIVGDATGVTKQVIAVCHGGLAAGRLEQLQALGCDLALDQDGDFDLANAVNAGVGQARHDLVVVLSDAIVGASQGWLPALLAALDDPGVGAVGARLMGPDGRLQHIGCGLLRGTPYLPYHGVPGGPGSSYAGIADTVREVAAVTATGLATRRSLFDEVGGFDGALSGLRASTDYCLKLRRGGRRVLFTGLAELSVAESAEATASDAVRDVFDARWDSAAKRDPYYNDEISAWRPYRWRDPSAVAGT